MLGLEMGAQIGLIALAVAAAAGFILRPGREGRPSRFALLVVALVVGGAAVATVVVHARTAARVRSIDSLVEEIPDRLVDSPDPTLPDYVSSDRCRSCHPGPYASWHRSYHRTMTQAADSTSVLGDFGVEVLEARGRRYRLERRGDEYWVEMADPDWERDLLDARRRPERVAVPPMQWKRIVMTTGSHHMQTYWVGSARDGRLFNFPWLWLIDEQRWIPREDGFIRPPEGARTFDVWHGSCVECHAVAGEKTRAADGRWAPEAAELGIACEACHGPADEHVRAHQSPLSRYRSRLSEGDDPTIVNPARLDAQRSGEVCGQCHGMNIINATALEQGHRFRPGGDLAETRIIMRTTERARDEALAPTGEDGAPDPRAARSWHAMQQFLEKMTERDESYLRDRFWPDGMIRVSGREHNGMIESACFEGGALSCLSCHSMHDSEPADQLARGREGDGACLQCHERFADAVESHTQHAPDSAGSRCANCHMPHTVYGLLSSIRSHWIDAPSVATERATGRANACSLCHLDRPLGWVADQLADRYGQPRPSLSRDEETLANGVRWLLTGDAHQRAMVAWHLGWREARGAWVEDDGWERYFLGHLLDDPYPAVRLIARRALEASASTDSAEPSSSDLLPRTRNGKTAPPGVRARARERVMATWRPRVDEVSGARGRALLLGPDGRPDAAAFWRLARERDDKTMDLRE